MSITFSLTYSLNLKLYRANPDPDSPDPKSEREISVSESPLDDLLDDGFRTEPPSSEFFDFLRWPCLLPDAGASCDGESEPWFEPRRCRLCLEPPDDESCVEESADGSDARWWRRVCFFAVLDSVSMDWCLDLGIKCRILDGLSFELWCSGKEKKHSIHDHVSTCNKENKYINVNKSGTLVYWIYFIHLVDFI